MRTKDVGRLVLAIVICELAGVIGSVFTISSLSPWYAGLLKPALNPPSWIFGPVWTTLYFLMGVSAFLVWQKGLERKDVKKALRVFGIQLTLNASWSIVFFGFHRPGAALLILALLWLSIAWSMSTFFKISRPAGYLLVPYLSWVSFAGYLNYMIWALNA